ncbi:MAG: Asp-tRNA(Asn)/Glu-tRNA(Gln) amidotransferase subunit GatA [Armatimonadetes bacterium]|nr:Asp-tRNA(Asn)/Glu-tRNA(Gln) amidotransferase subunit GatA [Armatimonadota bacterium]
MTDTRLCEMTIHELRDLLKAKQVSAVEIARSFIDRIEAVESRIKAFVTVTPELALEQAAIVDESIERGDDIGPLAGIPVAIKDNMCTRGTLTTCSSKILYNFKPIYDATVVDKLVRAGAVTIGKTNLDEFAMGSSTENSGFFVTHNPWNLDTVPGGSSGGSAAAVAADECAFALGSDTGGSIRQPASFCGVVGMKPTYGRVSRYGLVAFASSLDQIGPLTKDVTDCAIVMNAICGKDPLDSTSLDVPVPDFMKALVSDVRNLKIGVPKEFFGHGTDPEVESAVRAAIDLLVSLGAEAKEISMPSVDYGLPVYYIIAPAECSSNLARYDGVRYGHRTGTSTSPIFAKGGVSSNLPLTKGGVGGVVSLYQKTREEGFGPEVKQRIMIGTYALSAGYYDAYYLKAQKVRTLLRRDFEKAFEEFDVLITPTSPTVAFAIGERVDDPFAMKLADICTIPANLAGIPGISIPCGFKDGLPIGLQIMAKGLNEETLIRVAYTYEQHSGHHKEKPGI